MATEKLRPYILVGDGAFQMTGMEISTMVRLRLNPVILVLNNDGYGTMRRIREGRFNVISQWNYSQVCEVVRGGEGITVTTKDELDQALAGARTSKQLCLIEIKLPRNSASRQLVEIADEVRKIRGTEIIPSRSELL